MHHDFLIHNISKLLNCSDHPVPFKKGRDMSFVPELKNAWVLVRNGKIFDFGTREDQPTFDGIKLDADQGMACQRGLMHIPILYLLIREKMNLWIELRG